MAGKLITLADLFTTDRMIDATCLRCGYTAPIRPEWFWIRHRMAEGFPRGSVNRLPALPGLREAHEHQLGDRAASDQSPRGAAAGDISARVVARVKRRRNADAMEIVNAPTWLVIEDKYGRALKVVELPPNTDPRMILIAEMAKSIGMGFEVEELPGSFPLYYAKRGDPDAASFERNLVKVTRRDPNAQDEPRVYATVKPANVMPLKPRRDDG
ncbi:MAG: hypothetical protein WDO56_35100 [Gammaproteobacteria bacterium]